MTNVVTEIGRMTTFREPVSGTVVRWCIGTTVLCDCDNLEDNFDNEGW